MVARSAYCFSAALHLAVIGLILLLAQRPPSQVKPLLRYQPVRLVVLPGKPGPAPTKTSTKAETKPIRAKPKTKVKPAVKGTAKKQTTAKSREETGEGEGGSGSVRLDGANFPYPYYLSNIQIKILSNFKPVIRAKETKGLKAVVYFLVDRSGRISEVKLEDKSGHFLFDQEAQRAVLRSSPLPALPPAFGSDRLGVHFEFVASE